MAGQAVNIDDTLILTSFKDENTRDVAYTQLVRKYQERLYWHRRRMVVEHEDTNDILQNVFIKVWKHLANFKGEANLYTWLYRIATNETITWLDQKKRRGTVPIGEDDSPVADRLVAQKGFDANRLEWRLQEAIQALPEKQRIVFNLRYYDEMPYDEMSVVLDTSAGALKASYHHAAKKVEAYILQTTNG